jgi:hypothetical protein
VSLDRLLRDVLQNFAILDRDTVGFFHRTLSTIFALNNGWTLGGRGGEGVTGGVKSKGRQGGGVLGFLGVSATSSNLRLFVSGFRNAAGTSACVILFSFAVILSIMFLNSASVV